MGLTAPLVLIEAGSNIWQILGPAPGYGKAPYHSQHEDRRYIELCVVKDDLNKALAVLHRLEAGA